MPTVRVYNSTRMQAIEDTTVVSGLIVGDDLILKRRDNVEINAGNVRGATGPIGPAATPLISGAVLMWIMAAIPSGFLSLDGQTITNGQTIYPDLWAAAPAGWKSGANLILPNLKGKMPIHMDAAQSEFSALELSGGAKSRIIDTANLPSHAHAIDHDHANVTTTPSGDHQHSVSGITAAEGSHLHAMSSAAAGNANGIMLTASGASSFALGNGGTLQAHATYATPGMDLSGVHTHSITGSTNFASPHQHSVDMPSFSGISGYAGGAQALPTLPPYYVVRFIIKT